MAPRKAQSLVLKNREDMVVLTRLCKILPGGPYTYETVRYWCKAGRRRILDDPGSVVLMDCVKLPSGLASSVEAYYRFIDDLNKE